MKDDVLICAPLPHHLEARSEDYGHADDRLWASDARFIIVRLNKSLVVMIDRFLAGSVLLTGRNSLGVNSPIIFLETLLLVIGDGGSVI